MTKSQLFSSVFKNTFVCTTFFEKSLDLVIFALLFQKNHRKSLEHKKSGTQPNSEKIKAKMTESQHFSMFFSKIIYLCFVLHKFLKKQNVGNRIFFYFRGPAGPGSADLQKNKSYVVISTQLAFRCILS